MFNTLLNKTLFLANILVIFHLSIADTFAVHVHQTVTDASIQFSAELSIGCHNSVVINAIFIYLLLLFFKLFLLLLLLLFRSHFIYNHYEKKSVFLVVLCIENVPLNEHLDLCQYYL